MSLQKVHLYLVGFMGAGKTTVGNKLASKLKLPFVDLDLVIEREANIAIPLIFETYGQDYFRQLETNCLIQISQTSGSIVATGGGIMLSLQNRNILKQTGITIYLSWPLPVLYHRIKKSTHRPLMDGINPDELFQYIEKLFNGRRPLYEQADYIIHGDEKTTPEETVAMTLQQLPPGFIREVRQNKCMI